MGAGWGAALLLLAPTVAADVVPPGWTPPPRDAAALETCLPVYEESYGARGRPIEIRRSWETRSSYEMVSTHPEGAVRNPVMWHRISFDGCFRDPAPSGPGKATAFVSLVLRAGPERATVSSASASSRDPRVDVRCIEKQLVEGWSERITGAAAQLSLQITFSTYCRERSSAIPLPPVDLSRGTGGGGRGEGIGLGGLGVIPDRSPNPPRNKKARRRK